MRIALYTLGCKVNQYESQAMEALLLARGPLPTRRMCTSSTAVR